MLADVVHVHVITTNYSEIIAEVFEMIRKLALCPIPHRFGQENPNGFPLMIADKIKLELFSRKPIRQLRIDRFRWSPINRVSQVPEVRPLDLDPSRQRLR